MVDRNENGLTQRQSKATSWKWVRVCSRFSLTAVSRHLWCFTTDPGRTRAVGSRSRQEAHSSIQLLFHAAIRQKSEDR